MDSNAQYLLDNLETQLGLHNSLLKLLDKKRRALIERDSGGLEEISSAEEKVVSKIRRLTTVRASLVEKMSVRYAVPRNRRTLSGIQELFPENVRETLEVAAHGLSQTALQIVELDTVGLRLANQPDQDLGKLMGVLVGESASVPVKLKSV